MLEVEVSLRKAINELFHIVRMNTFMIKAKKEFEDLLKASDYELKIFERNSGYEKLSQAKEEFENMTAKVKNSYGNTAISNAYSCFKNALDNEEFYLKIGLNSKITAEQKTEIFKAAFDKLLLKSEKWDCELDCYSFFIENVKEIIMPVGKRNKDTEEICPYCDGIPQRIQKADFFGPHSGESDGYVWGCECGAYSLMDEEGNVIGKLADAILHQKRNLVRRAVFELCTMIGLTCFESYRYFSLITDTQIEEINDIEYLDLEQCNTALKIFMGIKATISNGSYSYPKNRDELLLFFLDGGRLSVCNAYGFRYGKVIVPSEVGVDGIKIHTKDGIQSIGFSKNLKYEFNNEFMSVIHPSGKKEKFKMLPEVFRSMIMSSEKDFNKAV